MCVCVCATSGSHCTIDCEWRTVLFFIQSILVPLEEMVKGLSVITHGGRGESMIKTDTDKREQTRQIDESRLDR